MLLLFIVTVFLSANLLFLVEPMVARMMLPRLGGSPAVWNTCLVFYQAVLLAGYAYAHFLSHHLRPRRQVMLHGFLLLLACVALPLGVRPGWQPPTESNPIPWLLEQLAVCVGLPFFALSAAAPLLQKWFAGTQHRHAADPYFLYAASNLGSMIALLAYPIVIERFLPLGPAAWWSQSRLWSLAYGFVILLICACAWSVWRGPFANLLLPKTALSAQPKWTTRLRWIVLASAPASLLLGVTSYITLDLAAVPLLWTVPLALYLFSFVLVFGRWPARLHFLVIRLTPVAVVMVLVLMLAQIQPPAVAGLSPRLIGIGVHLLTLFLVSLACHGELARTRPAADRLTGFYLLISVGGVLGGLFNALLAPIVFSTVVEYPLVLVLTCFLLPRRPARGPLAGLFSGLSGFLIDASLAALAGAAALWLAYWFASAGVELVWPGKLYHHLAANLGKDPALLLVAFGPFALLCGVFAFRPMRVGLSVGALALAAACHAGLPKRQVIFRTRDFFGVVTVDCDADRRVYSFWHGSTLHGLEIRRSGQRSQPLAYFHTTGPIGQVFRTLPQARARHIAVVGLGAGCLAAYARSGQHWTFYEIDPAVQHVAERYFTFLRDSRASSDIVLGDARLQLANVTDGSYGMIVLDAFSSDSIPMHLITREAFQMYLRKLTPHGVILVNITNRYVDLRAVLGNLAHDLRIVGRYRDDRDAGFPGKRRSTWVVLARRRQDLHGLPTPRRWQTNQETLALLGSLPGPAAMGAKMYSEFAGPWRDLPRDGGIGVWTDDFSNLLRVLRWRQ